LPEALATTADAHGHAAHHHPALQHHFETLEQQKEASILGMWIFIVQEVMFFGGLLMAYFLYRVWYHEAWVEGSRNSTSCSAGSTQSSSSAAA
jgi:cytochrome c oxidase subunit 3